MAKNNKFAYSTVIHVFVIIWIAMCTAPRQLPAMYWVGTPCGTLESMTCTSSAMYTELYTGTHSIQATVHMDEAQDHRGWIGIALNADIARDNHYIQAAITDNIIPFKPGAMDLDGFHGVMLADGADICCVDLGYITIAQDHTIRIEYNAETHIGTICIDYVCTEVESDLTKGYVFEFLCVGVDPGESGSNSVTCSFRDIVIEG